MLPINIPVLEERCSMCRESIKEGDRFYVFNEAPSGSCFCPNCSIELSLQYPDMPQCYVLHDHLGRYILTMLDDLDYGVYITCNYYGKEVVIECNEVLAFDEYIERNCSVYEINSFGIAAFFSKDMIVNAKEFIERENAYRNYYSKVERTGAPCCVILDNYDFVIGVASFKCESENFERFALCQSEMRCMSELEFKEVFNK